MLSHVLSLVESTARALHSRVSVFNVYACARVEQFLSLCMHT